MTELGESAALLFIKNTPDKYLRAKVIEVTFKGGYKTCRDKKTVRSPHWPAKADGPNQSRKPAVFPFGRKGRQKAKVKIKIDSEGYSGTGKLRGILKTLEFEGDVSLAAGEYTVETVLKEPPEGVAWIKGPMSWGVESPEMSVLAGATLAELFFVFKNPNKTQFFKKKGVWAEALRFLFKRSHIAGTKKEETAVKKVASCCFSVPWHKYDINSGAPKYGGYSETFRLAQYIDAAIAKRVNCYDQAYAVIVFSGALGLLVDGLFIEPFGFLAQTNLVGWGPCNNPFPADKFKAEVIRLLAAPNRGANAPVNNVKPEHFLVVDPKDPYRSGFGNHMFCEFGAKIFDACAGPVAGDGGRAEYVDHAIDKVMPPGYPDSARGTAAMILPIEDPRAVGKAIEDVV